MIILLTSLVFGMQANTDVFHTIFSSEQMDIRICMDEPLRYYVSLSDNKELSLKLYEKEKDGVYESDDSKFIFNLSKLILKYEGEKIQYSVYKRRTGSCPEFF